MKKSIAIILALAIIAGALTGCSTPAPAQADTAELDKVKSDLNAANEKLPTLKHN